MIVPMKKVSLVVLDENRKESLKQLRRLGVVHLETLEGQGAVLASYKDASATTDKAIAIQDEIKLPKKQQPLQVSLDKEASREMAEKIVSLNDRKKSLFDAISQGTQELDRFSRWGAVNPADFTAVAESGLFLYMYEIPEDKYSLIGDNVRTLKVNAEAKTVRFLLLSDTEVTERPAELPPEAYAVPMPEKSTAEIQDSIVKAQQEITRIDGELLDSKKYAASLAAYRKLLATDIEFETVYSGMGHEEAAEDEAAQEGAVRLAWLSGYVPVDLLDDFKSACEEHAWAYAVADPAEDDPVPTKLHNNKLVSLIYPLMDFLDVTPGYLEYDISGWFLLFFCIFFAMIFGDAGYGALIALLGIGLMAKGKKATPLSVLISLLGVCTMVWGVCTCSWFGIETGKLPETLRAISFKPVSPAKIGDTATTNQQILCFILALAQLSIAHVKNMIKYRKTLKFFGDFGSLLELWGMFYVVLDMVVDSLKYPLGITPETLYFFGVGWLPVPFVAIATLGVGFVLNFVFANYEGSIGKSVLESCKNIISVILGVVNVFSDIVSYIRLWAVALAGAAISNTVNTMAGPMVGKLTLFIFGIILLVFGHGLNMMLNVLSVIVHGVRLNTLEFSTHLGMTWSGVRYRPFREDEMPKEVRGEGLGKAVNAVGTMSKVVRV